MQLVRWLVEEMAMEEFESLRGRIVPVLEAQPVAFAYLFGSRARHDAQPDSDVDVAVRFDEELDVSQRFAAALRLGVALEAAAGCPVDVVDLDSAPLRLVGRILSERIVLLGADAPGRVAFETHQFKLAVDFEHHAAELDRQLLAAMARGGR